MSLVEDLLFWLSRRKLRRMLRTPTGEVTRTLTRASYDAWRRSELIRQLEDCFDPSYIAGKDVLDFGCGDGDLSFFMADLHPQSTVGTDLAEDAVATASRRAEEQRTDDISFVVAPDQTTLEFADESFDLICCFDTLEHIMHPDEIIHEWHRVLRPGGKVWIWWSPWRHPYGHHVRSLIPLPWVHVLFSEATLINVAARIYDDPCFIPRHWNMDPETGEKLPNKWRNGADLSSWLNRLTLRRAKAIFRKVGLTAQIIAYGPYRRGMNILTNCIARVPWIGEFFTSYYAIVLNKEAKQ